MEITRQNFKSIFWALVALYAGFAFWLYLIGGNPLNDLSLMRKGRTTSGFVIDAWEDVGDDERGGAVWTCGATYRFRLSDGREITSKTPSTSGRLGPEFESASEDNPILIEVEYLPDDPTINRIKGSGSDSLFDWLWRKVGLGTLILVLFLSPGFAMLTDAVRPIIMSMRKKTNLLKGLLQNSSNNSFLNSSLYELDQSLLCNSDSITKRDVASVFVLGCRVLKGHSVNSVAFSPNGTTLATGGADKTIKIWRVSDCELLRTLEGHSKDVYSVDFSPDGTTLASGSIDKTIKLWRASDGKLLRTLKGWFADCVSSVAFSADGTILASASADKTIKLWRASDGKRLRTLKGNANGVVSVDFSSDGKTLASGSFDRTIKLWRTLDWELILTIEGSDLINSVAFSPDGTLLASGSSDNIVKIWRVAGGGLIKRLEGHTGFVNSVAFSPDGTTLASGSADHTIKLWRVLDGQLTQTLEEHTDYVNSVAFSPDGSLLASGSWDKTIRLWRLK